MEKGKAPFPYLKGEDMLNVALRGISKIESASIAALFAFNLTILFVTIVMRYFFNNPPCWPEEASRYVMIWIVYLGAAQSIEKNSEIKIDVLTTLIPSKWMKIFTSIFAASVGLIVSVIISVYGIKFMNLLIETEQMAASFSIAMSYIYIIIPISGVLMSIKYFFKLVNILRNYRSNPQDQS